MKKTIKTLSVLALALALLLGLSAVAFAESSVSYKGGAEKFVFLEGGAYTDTDMFGGFKGVMPGDELTQKVTVRNSFTDVEYVKIYLRAVPHGRRVRRRERSGEGRHVSSTHHGGPAPRPVR